MALAIRESARTRVTLVDFDFVNPYFRSQDHRVELERCGVQVIAPDASVAQIDAPALPPAARDAILHPAGLTLVDLGGDPAGAIVIAQFAPLLQEYDLWAVVNFARPTTATPEEAADLLRDIAAVTRLRLTGLISNTHVGEYSTVEDILDGYAQAGDLGQRLGLPVVLVGAPADLPLPSLPVPRLPITRRLLRPWE